jgi:hypothetical protein
MAELNPTPGVLSPDVLSEAKTAVRDQLGVAWQFQADRIQDLLAKGWQEHILRAVDEGFADVETKLRAELEAAGVARQNAVDQALLEAAQDKQSALAAQAEQLRAEFEAEQGQAHAEIQRLRTEWEAAQQAVLARKEEDLRAELEKKEYEAQERVEAAYRKAHEAAFDQVQSVRKDAVRKLSDHLNQSVRRLSSAPDLDQWRDALLDGAQAYSSAVLLFRIQGKDAILEGARVPAEVRERMPAEELKIPLSDAPALANAVESKDMGVAVRTAGEFSESIADLSPGSTGAKVYLFPVLVMDQVVAVLYTEQSADGQVAIEPGALELLAAVAGFTLGNRRAAAPVAPIGLVGLAQAHPAPAVTPAPAAPESPSGLGNLLNSLSKEEQELHLRAQRFARVQVAEMRLYKSAQVKQGRASQNLYSALREDIDLSREAFKLQFMNNSKSMVDYLHLELVHTLANDEAHLLGMDYPGPLALQAA